MLPFDKEIRPSGKGKFYEGPRLKNIRHRMRRLLLNVHRLLIDSNLRPLKLSSFAVEIVILVLENKNKT